MDRTLISVLAAVGLFAGMLALLELGRRMGRRHLGRGDEGARAGLGAVEGAVFALLGLLVAFTFSGAAARFDQRRQWILDEANAIGTAWLRLDLLPASAQPELRELMRQYLDARLSAYEKLPNLEAARAELARASGLQARIWNRTVAASQQAATPLVATLVPALNSMFDIATTRTAVVHVHPPLIIFLMLGVLALMSSFLAGFAMAAAHSRSWTHMLAFALIMSGTVYVILDLEFPRIGLIRVDAADRVLYEVRAGMKD